MNITQQHNTATLTALMRAAWDTIYLGRDQVAVAGLLDAGASDEEMIEDDVPGPRLQAAWDYRTAAEAMERSGRAEADRVGLLVEAAGADMEDVLAPLVAERERQH